MGFEIEIKVGIASTELTNGTTQRLDDRFCINSNVGWCQTHIKTFHRSSKYQNGDKMAMTMNLKQKKVLFYNHTTDNEVSVDMADFDGLDYRLAVQIRKPDITVSIDNFLQFYDGSHQYNFSKKFSTKYKDGSWFKETQYHSNEYQMDYIWWIL